MLEEDEELLGKLAKECRNPNEKIRYLALHFLSTGASIAQVSKGFSIDRSTVYDWTIQWKNEKDLTHRPKEGPISSVRKKRRR